MQMLLILDSSNYSLGRYDSYNKPKLWMIRNILSSLPITCATLIHGIAHFYSLDSQDHAIVVHYITLQCLRFASGSVS